MSMDMAKEIYDKVRKIFERKIITDFWFLQTSIHNHHFNDGKTIMWEHIMVYKKSGNSFSALINIADLTNDNRFGKGLKELSKFDTTKSEFHNRLLLPFFSHTVENIRTKDHTDDDTTRK